MTLSGQEAPAGQVAPVTRGSHGTGRATDLAIAPGPIDAGLIRPAFEARLPAGPHGGFHVRATLSPNGGDVMH